MRRAGLLVVVFICCVSNLAAQCRVPTNSNEAKLLAFYSAPLSFSPAGAPEHPAPWTLRIGGEANPIGNPDPEIRQSGVCFTKKTEDTRLTPVFGRPRFTLTLPGGFAVEASYVPPIKFGDAEPNLGGAALSWVKRIKMAPTGNSTDIMLRVHSTFGQVRGPISCPTKSLQQADVDQPCFGTKPSRDTFRPRIYGVETVLSTAAWDGRLAFYAGAGANFLRPRYQIGFTDGLGSVDNTIVLVDLTRFAMFTGVTAEISTAFDLSAQVYGVREDGLTFRLGGGYRLYR